MPSEAFASDQDHPIPKRLKATGMQLHPGGKRVQK